MGRRKNSEKLKSYSNNESINLKKSEGNLNKFYILLLKMYFFYKKKNQKK